MASTGVGSSALDDYDGEIEKVFHVVPPSQKKEVKRVIMSQNEERQREGERAGARRNTVLTLLVASSFPSAADRRAPDKAILSSTNLQLLLYYNAFYSLAFTWFFALAFRWKVRASQPVRTHGTGAERARHSRTRRTTRASGVKLMATSH